MTIVGHFMDDEGKDEAMAELRANGVRTKGQKQMGMYCKALHVTGKNAVFSRPHILRSLKVFKSECLLVFWFGELC